MIELSQLNIIVILGIITMSICVILGCTVVYLAHTLTKYRDFYDKREKFLIHAIMAKHLTELGQWQKELNMTEQGMIKNTKLENDLAKYAAKISQNESSSDGMAGIPVG